MQNDVLRPRSYWSATEQLPVYPPLSANISAEVCVIGAGLAGLTCAYQLARQGVAVVVLEALEVGAGETGRTTAHIAVPDEGYWQLQATHGYEGARLLAESYAAAADFIESTSRDEQIECDFERLDGYLFSCATDPLGALRSELDAARRAGVRVTLQERAALQGFSGPALVFPAQAQFHPLRYLAGLARALQRSRGKIFAGTRVLDLQERHGGVIASTCTGKVTADAAVVATNTPFNDRLTIHLKQNAYQTYVVAAPVRRESLPRVLMWDDADPYHYVRLVPAIDAQHDLLVLGGADHKVGQQAHPEAHYARLERWLHEHFSAGALTYRWSGTVMEPLDGLAYIGRNPGSANIYVITGDSGNGMTHATIGGMLISDLLMGRQNRWLHLYDPARKPLREALEFLREQSNIAARYTDWISSADRASIAALANGSGAVIRSGLKRLALYRDEQGALHCHSAACTHLGCIVRWNAVEKTWDCPCHGSRFNAYGGVLHGPAVKALAPVDDEDWQHIVPPAPPAVHTPQERSGK